MQKLVGSKYRKLLKSLFLEVLIFGGDYTGRKICVSKSVRLILGEISAPSREPYQTVSAVYFNLRYFDNGPLEPGYVSLYIHHHYSPRVPIGG